MLTKWFLSMLMLFQLGIRNGVIFCINTRYKYHFSPSCESLGWMRFHLKKYSCDRLYFVVESFLMDHDQYDYL